MCASVFIVARFIWFVASLSYFHRNSSGCVAFGWVAVPVSNSARGPHGHGHGHGHGHPRLGPVIFTPRMIPGIAGIPGTAQATNSHTHANRQTTKIRTYVPHLCAYSTKAASEFPASQSDSDGTKGASANLSLSPSPSVARPQTKTVNVPLLNQLRELLYNPGQFSALSQPQRKRLTETLSHASKTMDINALCEALWLLGRLKMDVNEYTHLQSAFVNAVTRITTAVDSERVKNSSARGETIQLKSLSALLNAMFKSKYTFMWRKLPSDFRSALLSHIEQAVHLIRNDARALREDLEFLPEVIWSLGRLQCDFTSQLPISLQHAIVNDILNDPAILPHLHSDLAKLLSGLANMRLTWQRAVSLNKSPVPFNQLFSSLCKGLSQWEPDKLASLLYAMSRMQVQWARNLPTPVKQCLWAELQRASPLVSESTLANLIWSLSQMRVQWKYIPATTGRSMINRIVSLNRVSPRSLSSIVLGLSRMQVEWSLLPYTFRSVLLASIPDMTLLKAAPVTTIDVSDKETDSETVDSHTTTLSEQSVANIVYGLAGMGVRSTELNNQELFSMITYVSRGFSSQGIANTLYGLSKMDWQWAAIPIETQLALSSAVISKLHQSTTNVEQLNNPHEELTIQAVANVIWSLGRMQTHWYSDDNSNSDENTSGNGMLPKKLCDALLFVFFASAAEMTEQGLTNSLYGFARMGVTWQQLLSFNENAQELVLSCLEARRSSMTAQGLANALWALSTMQCPLISGPRERSTLDALLNHIPHCSQTPAADPIFDPRAMSTVLYVLGKLQVPLHAYPATKHALLSSLDYHLTRGTLQSIGATANVLYGLAKLSARFGFEEISPPYSTTQSTSILALPARMESAVLTAAEVALPGMSEQELGNTAWSVLKQMGVRYSTSPVTFKTALTRAVCAKKELMKGQALVAVLHSLTSDDAVSWDSLSSALKEALIAVIRRLLMADNKAQSECNRVVYSHSRRLAERSSPTSSVAVTEDINRNTSPLESLELTGNVVQSLGSLKIPLTEQSSSPAFDTIVQPLVAQFVAQGSSLPMTTTVPLVNIISGLAKMNYTGLLTSRLSGDLGLLALLEQRLDNLTARDVAALLWSFAMLGFRGDDNMISPISHSIVSGLVVRCERILPIMTSREFAWSIWALARMDFSYHTLSVPLKVGLLVKAAKSILQHDIGYANVPSSVDSSLVANATAAVSSQPMSSKEVGVLLWAVGQMGFPINELPLDNRLAFLKGIELLIAEKSQSKIKQK